MITSTQILDYMVSQKIPYVPCLTLTDLNNHLTKLGKPTIDEAHVITMLESNIQRVKQRSKLPKIAIAAEKINTSTITVNGKTFDVDAESQSNIVRALPIFDALNADAIQRGLSGMRWILSDNTTVEITKEELTAVYEAAGIRKSQVALAARQAKDDVINGRQIDSAILQLLSIDENCNPV